MGKEENDGLGPLPKLHPREGIVQKAEQLLRAKMVEWDGECDELSQGEYIRIISNIFHERFALMAKYMIRIERHDDPDKPGGQA